MRKLLFFCSLLLSALGSWAQPARFADPDGFAPDKPFAIIFDLNQIPDAGGNTGGVAAILEAAEKGEPIYIWTWNPGGDEIRDDPEKNGAWASSNQTMNLTYKGAGIAEFDFHGLSPMDFYKVTAQAVYDNDFQFLLKLKDGSKVGAIEGKTADMRLDVAPPSFRLYSIPPRKAPTNDSTFSRPTEVMTIFYDNKLETSAAMQGVDSVIIFYKVTLDNGQTVSPLSFNNSKNNSQLSMYPIGNSVFRMQFIPDIFLRQIDLSVDGVQQIPASAKITAIECQFVKKGSSTTAAPPNYKIVFSDCP